MSDPHPIAALRRALKILDTQGDWLECDEADACAALEDVEALVKAAERVRYLMDEGEEQMKTAAWTIAWNDAAEALRTALDKFTVREGQQPRAEEPDTYGVRPTYPPAWYEDTQ